MLDHLRHCFRLRLSPLALAGALVTFSPLNTANAMTIAIVGDSIGEGVQAADAAWQTQIYAYGAWVAKQLGAELIIPYIQTTPVGVVGDTSTRQRLSPYDVANNVSVSGANVADALIKKADADTPGSINTETDLVLFPGFETSQVDYVVNAAPDLVLCWIGANDALGAVTAFDALNASQLTPVAEFEEHYAKLAEKLRPLIAKGTKVVFANIPDVTAIGFLVDDATAEGFLGFPVNLEDGEYTTIVALLLMSLMGSDDLLASADFVLSEDEVVKIQERIDQFNFVIQSRAEDLGMPVVDINSWFYSVISQPPRYFGIPLNTRLLGGIFSLDQVHPSNIGHALIANEFINTINEAFEMDTPAISPMVLWLLFLTDPSIDKDGDGRARGRPGVGLLESLALILGLTGDLNDFFPD